MSNNSVAKQKSQQIHMIQKGFVVGLPIMLGYLPIAITYGVLAKQSGLSLMELTLMSAFVFAGASQFMAANMIAVGAGGLEIIIATFVLNSRHFVMSLSFMNSLRNIGTKIRIPLSLGLTDETFAVSSLHPEESKQEKGAFFYATIILVAYLSWIFGSLLGGVLGEIIPDKLGQSMGIALYAMFIGLLVPSVKRDGKVALIAIIAMLINVGSSQFVSDGWAIVLGTVLGSLTGVYFMREERE